MRFVPLVAVLATACTLGARGVPPIDAGSTDARFGDAGFAGCPAATTAASVRAWVETLPHGDAFAPFDAAHGQALRATVAALWTGDRGGAGALAPSADYIVSTLLTPTACYAVLAPTPAAPAGQATLVVRTDWSRDLLVEAPHVPNDRHTDVEAAIVFEAVGARGLVIAGAQRCATMAPSGCHANKECNPSSIAVASDVAHAVDNAFLAVHDQVAVGAGASLALQLHTNLELALNGDLLLATGTRATAPPGSVAAKLLANLAGPGIDARTCNDPGKPVATSAYCGETNAEGLATNGAADSCTALAATSTGTFLHLEQNSDRLADVDAWAAHVASAVMASIPAR